MALLRLPWTVTYASLGYRRSTLLVSGMTWTRLRNWFAASLLTMTAGRSFLISPAMDGPKLTHQTSPRFIGPGPDGGLGPFGPLALPPPIFGHLTVGRYQFFSQNVGT